MSATPPPRPQTPPPLPPPATVRKNLGTAQRIWIGVGVSCLILMLGAFGWIAWFANDLEQHPERHPQLSGWLMPDEEFVSLDESRRILRVRKRESREVYELQYQTGISRFPEWVPVPSSPGTLRKSWILTRPRGVKGMAVWQPSPRFAFREMETRCRELGYAVDLNNSTFGIEMLIASSSDPVRSVTATAVPSQPGRQITLNFESYNPEPPHTRN